MATPTTLPGAFTAGDVLTAANMNDLRGAFRILQVVSTTKTDTFTTSSTTFTDVTGLTVSITPSSTDSKVLVMSYVLFVHESGVNTAQIRLARGGTAIGVGAAAGSRTPASAFASGTGGPVRFAAPHVLDSPNTTSSTTYSLQIRADASGTVYVNRGEADSDAAATIRSASMITVMEISA